MNTMTNTAEFSNHTAPADHRAFFPALLKKMFRLLCMISALNSVEKELLAHHIVLE